MIPFFVGAALDEGGCCAKLKSHQQAPRPMQEEHSQHNTPRLLDIKELGQYLGRPYRTLERTLFSKSAPAGFPPHIRFGRRIFWSKAQIDAWLEGKPVTPQHPYNTPEPQELVGPQKKPRGRPRKVALP
jgi:predicted DNA-binding transcriptional regulator AlpA